MEVSSSARSSSGKSRKVEYIKLAQSTNNIPRLAAREMALGFNDKHILIGQVEEYNRRIQLPTFHIKGNFTSDVSVPVVFTPVLRERYGTGYRYMLTSNGTPYLQFMFWY